MSHQIEPFQVTCQDGVVLGGKLIIPESPKAVVQFNGGTAAKKEFYLPFLNHLADHGYLCALWDYRGNGESAPEKLGKCTYTFLEYGTQDMPAVKSYLQNRYPDLPFLFFGHSVGGQQLGFIDDLSGVKGLVGYAISTGYAPHMPLGYRLQSHFFFYMFSPISILLTGCVRAKRFGIMEDLPRNVVREWRAWCSKRNYFFNRKFYGRTVPKGQYDDLPFPVHVFWTTDDPISNRRSIPSLWDNITVPKGKEFTQVTPEEAGVKKMGHFGFFKKRPGKKLWPRAVAQLDAFLEA